MIRNIAKKNSLKKNPILLAELHQSTAIVIIIKFIIWVTRLSVLNSTEELMQVRQRGLELLSKLKLDFCSDYKATVSINYVNQRNQRECFAQWQKT